MYSKKAMHLIHNSKFLFMTKLRRELPGEKKVAFYFKSCIQINLALENKVAPLESGKGFIAIDWATNHI